MSTIAASSLAFEIFSTPRGPVAPWMRKPWSRSLPSGVGVPCRSKRSAATTAASSIPNAGGSPRRTSLSCVSTIGTDGSRTGRPTAFRRIPRSVGRCVDSGDHDPGRGTNASVRTDRGRVRRRVDRAVRRAGRGRPADRSWHHVPAAHRRDRSGRGPHDPRRGRRGRSRQAHAVADPPPGAEASAAAAVTASPVTVPVAFHVIRADLTSAGGNVTGHQIRRQVEVLNASYGARPAGRHGLPVLTPVDRPHDERELVQAQRRQGEEDQGRAEGWRPRDAQHLLGRPRQLVARVGLPRAGRRQRRRTRRRGRALQVAARRRLGPPLQRGDTTTQGGTGSICCTPSTAVATATAISSTTRRPRPRPPSSARRARHLRGGRSGPDHQFHGLHVRLVHVPVHTRPGGQDAGRLAAYRAPQLALLRCR